MRQRTLGKNGPVVAELAFGGAAISGEGRGYGFGAISEATALDLLHACFDAGINLYDTAPVYGFGLSEERLGKAFRERRDEVVLSTKGGLVWDARHRLTVDNRPATLVDMLEASLRRLGTDHVDLYFLHWPDPEVDVRTSMEALARERERGRVRHIGLSNVTAEHVRLASEIDRVEVIQNNFSLLERRPVGELFPLLLEQGLGFLGYGTLEKGILTGRVTKDRRFDEFDLRASAPWWVGKDHGPQYACYRRLLEVVVPHGHDGLETALGYVLQHREVSAALVGVRSRTQLESAVAALDRQPRPELLAEVEAELQKG